MQNQSSSFSTGTLLASFLTDGVYRGHYTPKTSVSECARIATSILESIRNPADDVTVKEARALPITQQLRSLPHRDDLSVDEICHTVSPLYLCLFAVDVPSIPIATYVERLVCDMRCGIECFVMAVVYILRCATCIPICGRSLHRVILTSVIIAAKTRDDKYYPISFYAKIGGTTKREVEAMEIAMLDILGFDARVPTATYIDMIYSLRMHCSTLAYVQRCEWAGKAWCDFIAHVPIPEASDLAGEINALTSSTYSDACDFSIHNLISANYSILEPAPRNEAGCAASHTEIREPVASGNCKKLDFAVDVTDSERNSAQIGNKSHKRTVSHPARIFNTAGAPRGAFLSCLSGAVTVPSSAHSRVSTKSQSVSLVRMKRSKSQVSAVSLEGPSIPVSGPRVGSIDGQAFAGLVSPGDNRNRLSYAFEFPRSCPVERMTEPFLDPCWNLSVSISASTATAAAASASMLTIQMLDLTRPAATTCPSKCQDAISSPTSASSINGPSSYCSTDVGPAPSISF